MGLKEDLGVVSGVKDIFGAISERAVNEINPPKAQPLPSQLVSESVERTSLPFSTDQMLPFAALAAVAVLVFLVRK